MGEGNDGRDGGRREGGAGGDGRRDGPPGTEFLDLEISQVIHAEASRLTRDAVRQILGEMIQRRIRERIGDRLEAIGRIAADELIDDLEANLAIEARIAARSEARANGARKVADALHRSGDTAARGADETTAGGAGRGSRDRDDARGSRSSGRPRGSRSSR